MSEASGIPSWARVGARVVCVDDQWPGVSPDDFSLPDPVKGDVYVLSSVEYDGYVGCYLVGFPDDAFYELTGFRPLVTDSEELGIEAQFYRAKARKSKAPARESEPVE